MLVAALAAWAVIPTVVGAAVLGRQDLQPENDLK
jgi:hypothetical protein